MVALKYLTVFVFNLRLWLKTIKISSSCSLFNALVLPQACSLFAFWLNILYISVLYFSFDSSLPLLSVWWSSAPPPSPSPPITLVEPSPLYSSQLEQLTSVTHTQALRQASRQRNRYRDPGRGQPPHWILHYTLGPPLNIEAKSISRWHDEESLRKFFLFYIVNQIWIFPQLQGLLQQHECEGEKGWVGNQLAQVILHAGSLEKRYSHFLSFYVLCQNTIGGLTFPTSLSFVWDEKQQKSKGGFYYFSLRSVKHKSFYYTDAT